MKGGSRNETLETSGAAHLTQTMLLKGTSSKSKTDITAEIENSGAIVKNETGREISALKMRVFKQEVKSAVKLLGDLVSNSSFNEAEVELAKEELAQWHEENHHRYMETTIENAHFNAYREHMLGQPKYGDRDNLQNLNADHVREFHANNYYGDNLVVVGAGDVDHESFVQQVNDHFGSLPKLGGATVNSEKPIYIPALLFVRDDEMYNSNVAVFYDAPSIKDNDYYAFLLLKNMFGSYRIDKNAEHLNDVKKQYNSMHALLGDLVDVTRGDSLYYAYSDCGIFGNYFFGNEVFTRQMNYCGVCLPTIYSHFLNDVEVFRGRNALYN